MGTTVQLPSHSLSSTQQFQSQGPTNSSDSTPTNPLYVPTLATSTTAYHSQELRQPAPLSTVHVQAGTQVGVTHESDHSHERAQGQGPPTTTQASKIGNAKKTPRHTPVIDSAQFESECLRKQINIAHTKIQELESELDKAKNTNHILGERIKTFEATNTKEVYERYFPKNPNTVNGSASSNQDISNHNLHHPQHTHYCCPPPPCRTSYCQHSGHDTSIGDAVRELSSKITSLGSNIVNMKSDIIDGFTSMMNQHGKDNPVPKEKNQAPLSPVSPMDPHQTLPEHCLHNVTDTSNMSETNSIDVNVPALSP